MTFGRAFLAIALARGASSFVVSSSWSIGASGVAPIRVVSDAPQIRIADRSPLGEVGRDLFSRALP